MNYSGIFILIAAVLVVFANQSDAGIVSAFQSGIDTFKDIFNIGNKYERETIKTINDSSKQNQAVLFNVTATNALKEAYINGTKQIASAEKTIIDGIDEANQSILKNPESATKILKQAFQTARNQLFQSGIVVLKAIGEALGLTNDAAEPGLNRAMQKIQRAGFSTLDAMNAAENLANQGLAAGGKAAQELLKAMKKTIEGGLAGSFNLIEESIQESNQAVRVAQRMPIVGQIKNANCQATATNDSVILDSIKDINEAVIKALTRGANPVLVENLRQVYVCELNELANITAIETKTVANLNLIADSDRSAMKTILDKLVESAFDKIHNLYANIYLVVGSVSVKSGNRTDSNIVQAILVLEEGKVEFVLGIRTIGVIIIDGQTYGGDALKLAKAAAFNIVDFSKLAASQSLVKSAQIVLSVI